MKTTEPQIGLMETKATLDEINYAEPGEINWNWSADKINEFINEHTLTEDYEAFSYFHAHKFTIWSSRLTNETKKLCQPGTLLPFEPDLEDSEFRVVCGDGVVLELLDLEMDGDSFEPFELCCRLSEKRAMTSVFDMSLSCV